MVDPMTGTQDNRAVKLPDDYEEAEEQQGFDPAVMIDGYEQARVPKPRMLRGTVRLCKCCFKTGIEVVDTVCPGCLASTQQLAQLRVEIGRKVPAALTMSLPALFRALWQGYQKAKGMA